MSVPHDDAASVTNGAVTLTWQPGSRLACARFAADAHLTGKDGAFLVEHLGTWQGGSDAAFGFLADCRGLRAMDAEYRANVNGFFRQHPRTFVIALTNLSPVVFVIAEMFRIATGIQVKALADESAARIWLRTKGVAA